MAEGTDRLAMALRDLETVANWLRGMADAPGLDASVSQAMRWRAGDLDAVRKVVAEARTVLEDVANHYGIAETEARALLGWPE